MNFEYSAFHKVESNFFSLVSVSQVHYDNLIAYATGVHAAGLNPAIIHQLNKSIEKDLVACQAFYAEKNLPWTLVVPEYYHHEPVSNLLKNKGLQLSGKGVAMRALIDKVQFQSLTSLLRVVEMPNDLQIWSIPLIHGFESTDEITGAYTKRHQLASQSGTLLYHFSGFIKDTVICSLSLSLCDGYARIDDVATMPFYQKKGYATSLIYATLKHLQSLSINTCFLEASASGLELYKRIGFHEIFINYYYEPLIKNIT